MAGIAYLDLLSGKFYLDEGDKEAMLERLRVIAPQEIIFPSVDKSPAIVEDLKKSFGRGLTPFEGWNFDYHSAEEN